MHASTVEHAGGQQGYLHGLTMWLAQDRCLDWFPRLRAISLAVEDVEAEQNEWRTLQAQVVHTPPAHCSVEKMAEQSSIKCILHC